MCMVKLQLSDNAQIFQAIFDLFAYGTGKPFTFFHPLEMTKLDQLNIVDGEERLMETRRLTETRKWRKKRMMIV